MIILRTVVTRVENKYLATTRSKQVGVVSSPEHLGQEHFGLR
jgi:hypothetical protein